MISNDKIKSKLLKMAFNGDLLGIKEKVESNKGYYAIPNNWEWKKIGDIVNIVNGFTPLRTEKTFWDKPEINWFTIEDMRRQGHFINKTEQFITKKALGNSSNRLLPPNTILLCCTASVGEVAFTNIPLTTNQQFNGLIVKDSFKNDINPLYIFEYAKTLKDILIEKAGKTTINFVSTKKLSEILIPIPSYDEQNEIVSKLEPALELIEHKEKNDNKMIKLKEILKEKIIDSAIHGTLVENDNQNSEDLIEHIKKERSKYSLKESTDKINNSAIEFAIPKNWNLIELYQLYNFIDYRGMTPNKISEGVPLITATNIRSGYLDMTKKDYITEEDYNKRLSRGETKQGDLLFTTEAPMGNCAINTFNKCSTGQRIITFQTYGDSILCNKLFMYFINSKPIQQEIKDNATGVTATGIKASKLKKVLIPVPPFEEQKRIVEKIESLFELIEQL